MKRRKFFSLLAAGSAIPLTETVKADDYRDPIGWIGLPDPEKVRALLFLDIKGKRFYLGMELGMQLTEPGQCKITKRSLDLMSDAAYRRLCEEYDWTI